VIDIFLKEEFLVRAMGAILMKKAIRNTQAELFSGSKILRRSSCQKS